MDQVRVTPFSGPIEVIGLEAAPIFVRALTGPATVTVHGMPGPQGEPGGDAPTWTYYATRWSSAPAAVGGATVSGNAGTVYAYTLDGTTRYRFVPTSYAPALDAFYSAYASGVLAGLIVSRG